MIGSLIYHTTQYMIANKKSEFLIILDRKNGGRSLSEVIKYLSTPFLKISFYFNCATLYAIKSPKDQTNIETTISMWNNSQSSCHRFSFRYVGDYRKVQNNTRDRSRWHAFCQNTFRTWHKRSIDRRKGKANIIYTIAVAFSISVNRETTLVLYIYTYMIGVADNKLISV